MNDARSTLPFGFEEFADAPRRRRRVWPWVVTLAVVLALLLGAAVGAEALTRGAVEGGVRQLVKAQLDLPADQQVDVHVPGLVLPQLVSGRLGEIEVGAPDVALGPVAGDVTVTLTDVPIAANSAAGPGTATVRLDQTQLQSLLATVEGFPADAVGVAAPDITLSTELSLFGAGIPVGVALQPGASGGNLTLSPSSFTVGGAVVDADALRAQFGGLADSVLREWSVCIAQHLPAALALTDVAVDGAQVVARFDIDGAVVVDPALRATGACG
ncbi:LmeA family phospholipid-binding protein [Microbacterium sp. RD1]|uniref:LmeA family phospholipid-binding protein n=1 Tax=Microbacterium sp. RD1 TaxID=3457313 RepID=UPI003FA5DE39